MKVNNSLERAKQPANISPTSANIKMEHNANTSNQNQQQMHVCRLCDKLLSSSSSLDRHMLTHSGERPFVCKRCHMTFTTNGNMHRHMRTHLHKDSLARQQQEQMQLKQSLLGVAAAAAAAAAASAQTNPGGVNANSAEPTISSTSTNESTSNIGRPQSSNSTQLINTTTTTSTCSPANLVPQLLIGGGISGVSSLTNNSGVPLALHSGSTMPQPQNSNTNSSGPFFSAALGPLLMNQQLMAALRQQQQQVSATAKLNISNHEHLNQSSGSDQSLESVRAVMLAAAAAAAAAASSGNSLINQHQNQLRTHHRAPIVESTFSPRERGKRRKQVRPRSHKQYASSTSSSSSPAHSALVSRDDLESDIDAEEERERAPQTDTNEQKSIREVDLGQDLNNNQEHMTPDLIDPMEGRECHRGDSTGSVNSDGKHLGRYDGHQERDDDADSEARSGTGVNSSSCERSISASRGDNIVSEHTLDDNDSDDDHRVYNSTMAMTSLEDSQDEFSFNQDDTKHEAISGERDYEADSDEDDDERQNLRVGSPQGDSSNLGDTISCNHTNQTLPITTIDGEVIEDISQSYVKTANPNAAKKGGKRNRHCYKCKLCTYSSVDRCTLVRHLRIHSGERPYICGICRYAFTTKANCERHVRKRHKKQYNSLGGSGGVKGSNGGGRSLIITDHSNHQTIPVKVNPVAAQTISQTLLRIQEKEMLEQQSLPSEGQPQQHHRQQQQQQQHRLSDHDRPGIDGNNNGTSELSGPNFNQQTSNKRTSLHGGSSKRKQRLLAEDEFQITSELEDESDYQRRGLASGKQSLMSGLFADHQGNNPGPTGHSLLARKHNQLIAPPFSLGQTSIQNPIESNWPGQTGQLSSTTSELLANLVAQLQAANGLGGGSSLMHRGGLGATSSFNPLDLAAQALDLSNGKL